MKQFDDVVKISRLVKLAFNNLGCQSLNALHILRSRWQLLTGDKIAKHSAPLSIEKKTLTIVVDDAAYKQQLAQMDSELIMLIRALLQNGNIVKRLRFKVGIIEHFIPPEPQSKAESRPNLSAKQQKFIEDQTAPISNRKLRNSCRRWLINIKTNEEIRAKQKTAKVVDGVNQG